MGECFAYIYVKCANACSDHKGQKKVLDPPGMELHSVVSCHIGPGT